MDLKKELENMIDVTFYKPDRTKFGGEIHNYDYDGCQFMSDVAERILTDWKRDREWAKNAARRDYCAGGRR